MKNNLEVISFMKQKRIELVVLFYLLAILFTGLSMQSFEELIQGLGKIFTATGVLITDNFVIGGIGPSLVNGSGVALIGYILLVLNKVPFRGISIAVIFTMFGFAFLGKNMWSILPIILGVFFYSKLTGREFVNSIYPALFGTALSPFVTLGTFDFGWGVLGGTLIGIVIGIVIPATASHVLSFHEGYNLYNVGFTAGFIGLIFINILRGYGLNSSSEMIWGTEFDTYLLSFLIIILSSMLILGFILAKHRLKDYLLILKHPGTLITDFTNIAGFGNTLINMGLVGFIAVLYIKLVGGNFNGPTLAGIFTMVGFAAFGKHPFNVTPIMAGVYIGTIFSIYDASIGGPLLSALFGTALAPIAGQFGPIVGILAGFIHLSVASNIGIVHGGLNLYNNGFSAGFVAALFIALRNGFKKDS